MSKSLLLAIVLALGLVAGLSAEDGPPGGNSDTPDATGVVEVHIARSVPFTSSTAFGNDLFLARVADYLATFEHSENAAAVAGYLSAHFDEVLLLPSETKYYYRKNVVTCVIEKLCVVCDLIVVVDPDSEDNPVVVGIESTNFIQ